MILRRLIFFAMLFFSLAASAAELVSANVVRDGANFHVYVKTRLAADAEAARRVLSDYNHFTWLHHAIKKSEVLSTSVTGAIRMRTELRSCIIFFCKDLVWVGDVEKQANGDVRASTIPELSTFKAGVSVWRIIPVQAKDIEFEFISDFTPSFWVPPLLGAWLIKYKIEQEVMEMSANIQRLATLPVVP